MDKTMKLSKGQRLAIAVPVAAVVIGLAVAAVSAAVPPTESPAKMVPAVPTLRYAALRDEALRYAALRDEALRAEAQKPTEPRITY